MTEVTPNLPHCGNFCKYCFMGTLLLASLCNPIAFAGIVGNLFTLLPWPLDQIDHGTESTGHLLVLALGLVLLREMTKSGELKEMEVRR